MKFKKVISVMLLLFILFSTFGVYAADMTLTYNWPYGSTISSAGDINNGYGVYIKLIKYDVNTRKETIVGTPILIYNGALLESVTEIDSSASGASSGTSSGSSNVVFCVANSPNDCGNHGYTHFVTSQNSIPVSIKDQNIIEGGQSGGRAYAIVSANLGSINPNWNNASNCTKSTSNTYGTEQVSYYKSNDIWYLLEGSTDDPTIANNIRNYLTKNIKVIYDANLPSNNMYSYIKSYLLDKYAGTIAKIYSSFNVNASSFDITELDTYYLAFEPVVRKKTNVVVNSWQTSTRRSGATGTASWNWTCSVNGNTTTGSSTPSQECSVYHKKTCETRHPPDDKHKYYWYTVYDCSWTENGQWERGSCASYRYNWTSTLVTQHSEKVSVIQPARYNDRVSITSTLTTAMNQEESKHCVLNKNNECTGVYEYFIGPNLNTALVGTTGNNKYQLYNGTQAFTKESAKTNAVGVSYWWLPSLISCNTTCPLSLGSTSDELLKCAENYCDNSIGYDERANTQQLKAQCITGLCGYQYTPVSCSNSNPYLNQATGVQDIASSSICGFLESDGSPTDGNKRVTTSCVSDTTDVFDAKTYINIACKETSSFQFTDLSNKKLVAGQGLDYYTKLKGNKECTVFFDLNTWKFAYASYHSEDVIRLKDGTEKTARQLLVDMLNYYNSGITASGSSAIGIDMSGQELETTWNDLNYNINKVSVKTKVTEIVNNIKITSSEYTLTPTVQNIDNKLDISGNQSTMMFENLVGKRLYVNKYIHTSNADVSYTFDKYCVSNDGTATVYKAPDNGVCYTTGSGGSLKTVLGKNLYYTNLNATANKDFSDEIKKLGISHAIDSTKATVEDENTGVNYVEDDDYCPYEIDGNNLQCTIVVTANEGTEMHGNGIYANGSVTAKLYVQESLGTTDKVATKSITSPNASMSNIMDDSVVIDISDKKNGVEQLSINGTVTTEKGKKATCNKTIYIINPDSNCGVSCSVEEYNGNNVYEIRSTGRQTPKQYQTALSTNMNWIVVFPDITTRKYLVRVSDPKIDTIVYGKVEGTMLTTNEKCYNVCWSDVPELSSCPNEYEAADTNGIKEYCESNWDMDINNYENVDECVNSCSRARMCADNRRDIKEVTDTCTNNYLEWGFSDPSNCINYCYYCPECSSDYIYRPVNNYNPFPYSSDSNTLGFNYQTGDRIVPSNWVGKTGYIKQDDKDTTSVTGVNSNQKAEYVIELTPSTIRSIRSDTESYNSETSGNDAYLDYVYMQGVDTTKRYYSKFINETFRSYFTMINGETVK